MSEVKKLRKLQNKIVMAYSGTNEKCTVTRDRLMKRYIKAEKRLAVLTA